MSHTPYDALTGAIIGLARATEGNEALLTDCTHRAMLGALSMEADEKEETIIEMISAVRDEKRKLVPNCFDCAMPCGRTSDFDLHELISQEESLRTAKLELLSDLRALAKVTDSASPKIPHFYEALCFIGYDYATIEQIQKLKEKILS
jgi:hydroxylamine reductase